MMPAQPKPPRKRIYHLTGEAQINADGIERQNILVKLWPNDPILLRREPDNEFDPNAIAATDISGQVIGYIEREHAGNLAAVFDAGLIPTATIHRMNGGMSGYECIGVEVALTWTGQKPMTPTGLNKDQLVWRDRKADQAAKSSGCMGMVAAVMMMPMSVFYFVELFS